MAVLPVAGGADLGPRRACLPPGPGGRPLPDRAGFQNNGLSLFFCLSGRGGGGGGGARRAGRGVAGALSGTGRPTACGWRRRQRCRPAPRIHCSCRSPRLGTSASTLKRCDRAGRDGAVGVMMQRAGRGVPGEAKKCTSATRGPPRRGAALRPDLPEPIDCFPFAQIRAASGGAGGRTPPGQLGSRRPPPAPAPHGPRRPAGGIASHRQASLKCRRG